jgi:hypothetical protein
MSTIINGETYLTANEAMAKLQVSRPKLDGLVRDGLLKRYRQGIRKVNYYKLSDLDLLLEVREDRADEK